MLKKLLFYGMIFFYVSAGINHFIHPDFYLALIPPYLPFHTSINLLSGLIEIALGLCLIPKAFRRWAAVGIIVMLIAFIPSHVYFIEMNSCIEGGLCTSPVIGWGRLIIIHPLLIVWAWWCGFRFSKVST